MGSWVVQWMGVQGLAKKKVFVVAKSGGFFYLAGRRVNKKAGEGNLFAAYRSTLGYRSEGLGKKKT